MFVGSNRNKGSQVNQRKRAVTVANEIDKRYVFTKCEAEFIVTKNGDVTAFDEDYRCEIESLKGNVTMIVGRPPCQGFSFVGRRDSSDERNQLFSHYIRLVELLSPVLVLLENVRGIAVPFDGREQIHGDMGGSKVTVADEITTALENLGYRVYTGLIDASMYGVPQKRCRYILVAAKIDARVTRNGQGIASPFSILQDSVKIFGKLINYNS